MEQATPGDASTLIYIAKADAFEEAVTCVGPIGAPPTVWSESVEAGERIGAPEVTRIRAAAEMSLVRRENLDEEVDDLATSVATEHRLGGGESEVIALATRTGTALLDEGRATRAAAALGISVISTLFLPVVGLRSGRVDEERAVTLLRRLAPGTGATAAVVQTIEQHLRGE